MRAIAFKAEPFDVGTTEAEGRVVEDEVSSVALHKSLAEKGRRNKNEAKQEQARKSGLSFL
jgi:hypothetical protein